MGNHWPASDRPTFAWPGLKALTYLHRHLPKNFDNVHNLEFRRTEKGDLSNVAIGMYSGENEYVAFTNDCVCEGPVEAWLQVTLADIQRLSIFTVHECYTGAYCTI